MCSMDVDVVDAGVVWCGVVWCGRDGARPVSTEKQKKHTIPKTHI